MAKRFQCVSVDFWEFLGVSKSFQGSLRTVCRLQRFSKRSGGFRIIQRSSERLSEELSRRSRLRGFQGLSRKLRGGFRDNLRRFKTFQ